MLYEDILREFNKKKVQFVIVGGVAFNLLGGIRATQDLDILVKMNDENLKKAISILLKKGYRVKQPVNPMDFANKKIRKSWIKDKNMKAFNFYKGFIEKYEEIDIIIDSPVTFENANKDVKIFKIDGIRVPVISINKLIKMKSTTDRELDHLDIKELKAIKEIKK